MFHFHEQMGSSFLINNLANTNFVSETTLGWALNQASLLGIGILDACSRSVHVCIIFLYMLCVSTLNLEST